ncbi:Spt20 family-domain-containing protein [Talaromyces proteolyticus]|uniref:Spt20 family-domain-containing protein n=1 Tax=Talaromyces proteolyticus TaxID=1131652 RepID=A0AAD4KTY9_9EURO|nr:Spt20 family-domain-containing protein [Talaromyces proteolyticus]KAH8699158.1 Spt20 family-domain-containing protein [Talaromyces proteolyticus]
MATAVSKLASQPPKMKRPPPSFTQTGVNGIKQSPSASSSPSITSKRLPGANQSSSATSVGGAVANGANSRPVNKSRKDLQRPGDPPTRLQRPSTRNSVAETDRRQTKIPPEPFVKTTSYILKKYSNSSPSLILHLHPTHFRFEQQDGSFPYNSEMKVIIEHIRSQTVPHDMLDELLRAGVKFYEGCLIVKVVDHKSMSAQTSKSTVPSSDEKNTPFSIHNYNQHVTPSPYLPYPKQNQVRSEKLDSPKPDPSSKETSGGATEASTTGQNGVTNGTITADESIKQPAPKPKVFTTVLHPTPLSIQAELVYLSTTPHPHANVTSNTNKKQPAPQGASKVSTSAAGQPPAKRQRMLVEPQDLPEFEAKLIRAVAPPVYLDPVDSFESVQQLLHLMESPLHSDKPPSPKTRKRTVAELAADEALAAEEERFMLIMDERLEPATSGAAGNAKSAVDDTAGAVPFEPRFSRFKTIENIRVQHEEKAKREHEMQIQQEHVKRQQQEQERERRRALEQRQAEENAKEERRQQLAAAQAQAQIAAQQQQRLTNGLSQVSQGQMSSPIVRNQTPHNVSSPVVGNNMVSQGGVSMSMSASAQGAGSPPRPPSTMQHAHPGVMSHPMAPSRSQQSQSRNGTPQLAQGTPAMTHATPVMRNVTPTQRMNHSSPPNSTMAQTPVMNQPMMTTPQMGAGVNLTPQQQHHLLLQQQRQQQQMLAQQGLTPQQMAQLQAHQNIQNHQQQQLLHQQQQLQQNQQQQMQHNMQSQQSYQAQLLRSQMAQMQLAQQKTQQQPGGMQMTPQQQQQQQHQQQQMLMAAAQAQAQANGGQMAQSPVQWSPRHQQMYQQRVVMLRQDMVRRYQPQYGSIQNFPAHIGQQYGPGVEKNARAFVMEVMRKEQQAIRHAALMQQQQQHQQQQQQQQMMANGMGK